MSFTYSYTTGDDFAAGLDTAQLQAEILADATISADPAVLTRIDTKADAVSVIFDVQLGVSGETSIAAVVSAHSPDPSPEAIATSDLVYTNRGSAGGGGGVTEQSIPATPGLGDRCSFLRLVDQTYRAKPLNAAHRFRRADNTLTTAGKGLELATDGACLTVTWVGSNEWLILGARGTINEES